MTRHSETHHEYQRRMRRLSTIIAQLTELQGLLADAHDAAQFFLSGTSSGLTERVSGGDTSKPTESALFARAWVFDKLATVDAQLTRMDEFDPGKLGLDLGAVVVMKRELSRLVSAGVQSTEDDAPPRTNMVDCTACGRTITMTPNDRPRGGWCSACVMAFRRLELQHVGPGAPDRAQFERNRAKWSGLEDDPVEIRSRIDRMEITRYGETRTLSLAAVARLASFGPIPPEEEILRAFEDAAATSPLEDVA